MAHLRISKRLDVWLIAVVTLVAGEVSRRIPSTWQPLGEPWNTLIALLDRPASAFFLACFLTLAFFKAKRRDNAERALRTSSLIVALLATFVYLVFQVALIFFIPWSPEGHYNIPGLLILVGMFVVFIRLFIKLAPQVTDSALESKLRLSASVLLVLCLLPLGTLISRTLSPQQKDARAKEEFGSLYEDARKLVLTCGTFERSYGPLQELTLVSGSQSRTDQVQKNQTLGVFIFAFITSRTNGELFVIINRATPTKPSFSVQVDGQTDSDFIRCTG